MGKHVCWIKKDYKPKQEKDREKNSEKKGKVANELKEIGSFSGKKEKSRKEQCEKTPVE